jgi:hypothetical protein
MRTSCTRVQDARTIFSKIQRTLPLCREGARQRQLATNIHTPKSFRMHSHQRTRGAPLLLSESLPPTIVTCSLALNTNLCPRLTPLPPPPPPPPTFNRSSMPPWRHMRGRQSASFSLTLLPPSCSPATTPSPFYLPFKTFKDKAI